MNNTQLPLTDTAQKVIAAAESYARSYNHDYVGTEHVLFALLTSGKGIVSNMLVGSKVDPEAMLKSLKAVMGPTGETPVSGSVPLTPRVKYVLTAANGEAEKAGSDAVGTEHILIGLIVEGESGDGECNAAKILKTYEFTPAAARSAMAEAHGDQVLKKAEELATVIGDSPSPMQVMRLSDFIYVLIQKLPMRELEDILEESEDIISVEPNMKAYASSVANRILEG